MDGWIGGWRWMDGCKDAFARDAEARRDAEEACECRRVWSCEKGVKRQIRREGANLETRRPDILFVRRATLCSLTPAHTELASFHLFWLHAPSCHPTICCDTLPTRAANFVFLLACPICPLFDEDPFPTCVPSTQLPHLAGASINLTQISLVPFYC